MHLIIILFITLLSFQSIAQVSGWKNYTDMKNTRDVVTDGNIIWGASDGGVFSFNIADNSFTAYSKTEGLNGTSITAAAIDKYGKLWFGSNNGTIDVYNPQTKNFRTILDISLDPEKIAKVINNIAAMGDTIIVSSDFGISLIDANTYLFIDTFLKFGSFPSNISVNSVFKPGLIYGSTDRGVAIQKPGTTNLSAPESWNVYSTLNGLPADSIVKIVSYKDSIIAATSKGLSFFNGIAWQPYLTELNGILINDLMAVGDSLFILSEKKNLYKYYNGEITLSYSSTGNSLNKLNYSAATGILLAASNGILKLNDGLQIFPNGPNANQFPSITVDPDGNFWSASGRDNTGVGFYKYDGSGWTNYNVSSNPELPTNGFYSIYSSSSKGICIGNWGNGITVLGSEGFKNYKENLSLQGIQRDPNFLVITGFAEDSKNNLWILNYGAADRKVLAKSSNLEQWTSYFVPPIGNVYVEEIFTLAIDQFDTKWFGVQRGVGKIGLYYFNEGNNDDPSIITDDAYGFLDATRLSSNFISAIAVDKRGDVWVGTSLGVNIISNVNSILTSNPRLNITSVFSLRQQTISAIVVDPLNQKWVGTNQGLHLVNSDGTSLIATFTTQNFPLLSDAITSLAIDENSGTIYVGSEEGLTSFKTFSIEPVESFDGLFVSPNPFIIGEGDNQLIIDGLIADTDIKILTIGGKLVKQYTSPGGKKAPWDGRDENGELVPTGIYFVVAFDQEGNSVETGKIAVIRR